MSMQPTPEQLENSRRLEALLGRRAREQGYETVPLGEGGDEIAGVVTGRPMPKSKIGKPSFWGTLGDAFLVQSGNKPMYAPKRRQAQIAEAMEDFTTDPLQAIQRLNQFEPELAAELWDKVQDNQRQDKSTDATVRNQNDDYEGTTHSRAGALIGAATPNTYGTLRKRYYDYYAARGVEPMIELPETYDQAALEAARLGYVSPEKQVTLESQEEYRNAVLGQRRSDAAQRAELAREQIRTRREEGEANRKVRVSEGAADRQTREKIAASKGRSRPAIKFGTRPDGTRYVIQ